MWFLNRRTITMLNSNDSAKVLTRLANDLIQKEKHDIVSNMDSNARVDFYNSVKTLTEISDEIEKSINTDWQLFFISSGI